MGNVSFLELQVLLVVAAFCPIILSACAASSERLRKRDAGRAPGQERRTRSQNAAVIQALHRRPSQPESTSTFSVQDLQEQVRV